MTRTRTQTKRDKDVLSVHKPVDFGAMPTYSFKFVSSADVEILDCNEKITDACSEKITDSIFIGLGDIHQGRVEVQRSVFDDEVLHDVPLTSMEIEHAECVKPMLIETVEDNDEVPCESVDEQCASQQERILELERENEELRKRLEQLQDETCFWMLRG